MNGDDAVIDNPFALGQWWWKDHGKKTMGLCFLGLCFLFEIFGLSVCVCYVCTLFSEYLGILDL